MLRGWTGGTISQGHAGTTRSMLLPDQALLPPHACRAGQYPRKRDQTVPWTWLHNRALVPGMRQTRAGGHGMGREMETWTEREKKR